MSQRSEPAVAGPTGSTPDSSEATPSRSGNVSVPTRIQIRASEAKHWHRYTVAGALIDSDVVIPALEAFVSTGSVPLVNEMQPAPCSFANETTVRGWTGGSWRDISTSHDSSMTALAVQDVGCFTVDNRGLVCAFDIAIQDGVIDANAEEMLLGPCLAAALAKQQIFLAHASAVTNELGEVVLFAGNSGTGKSTIARELSEAPGSTWTRVADDIVALKMKDSRLVCLTDFPQLKLDASAMTSISSLPDELVVKSLYAASLDIRGGPMQSVLSPADLMTQFVRHGVSLRVLDAPAVADHFEFASAASVAIQGFRLSWSHRPDALWALETALKSL